MTHLDFQQLDSAATTQVLARSCAELRRAPRLDGPDDVTAPLLRVLNDCKTEPDDFAIMLPGMHHSAQHPPMKRCARSIGLLMFFAPGPAGLDSQMFHDCHVLRPVYDKTKMERFP